MEPRKYNEFDVLIYWAVVTIGIIVAMIVSLIGWGNK